MSILIEKLSKDYGGAPVLSSISTSIAQGEFVAVLGASGCGKSTLLNIVAGLEPPTAGAVTVPAGGAAFMFQDAALLPWLTARANIELALQLRGVPRAQRKDQAQQLLELVHLGDAGSKRPHELSGGMRQRASLARALGQDKPVLLMDEPFAALDAITRDLLHEELERIWLAQRRTVLFVTHNVREAVRLGQRVLLLSSRPGRLAAQWDIDPMVRTDPATQAALTQEITQALREEIRHHAH
jgi:NitT/TauT family transport system ATP-binding protein